MQPGNPSPTDLPTQIGPFRALAQIGEGSFGVVYKAERREPVRQTVALKVLRAGVATKEVLARFELERKALAAMNHRCIAKVLDAGATERGEPWVAMELVEGLPLTAYCDKHRLSLKERIVLFQQVCDGVQHAHQKGVVHRDLKPGNVFVVREGEQHVPKILDFGLAKATHRDVFGGGSFATQKDMALGTLEYMSPEQAAGDGEAIDARSDVYSLGVMLYELLCGELPFPSAMLKAAGEMEARRVVVEQEPKKPSTKLLSRQDSEVLAAQRRSSLGALKSALAGDLDWVVLKAMRKEPEGRYGAALALAADLGRYLAHEPLEAGPPSVGYRAKKFVRKYRGQLMAGTAVLLTAVTGTVVAVQFAAGEAEARKHAEDLAEKDRIYADLARLQEAESRAEALYPAWPSRIPDFERWITDVEPILQRLPQFEAELAKVRMRARPIANEERAAARATITAEIERLRQEANEAQPRERRALQKDIADAEVSLEAAGYEFEERADAERHLQLAKLVTQIRLFGKAGPILMRGAMVSVQARLAQARALAEAHAKHKAAWQEAIAAIAKSDGVTASTLYAHFELTEQEGLVPIGMDPESKLWEFVHLPSGTPGKEIPQRDPATGRVVPDGDMGIVFVLLPGGTSWVGTTGVALDRAEKLVASLRREIALASGAAQLETPKLPADLDGADADELNSYAWLRVAPEESEGEDRARQVFGEEALALVAARTAVIKETGAGKASPTLSTLETLAWALVVNGQDAEAKRCAAEALAMAPAVERTTIENSVRDMHAAIEQRAARLQAAEARAAEPDDLHCPNFDAQRRSNETPHRVTLAPYFLSKYEMTQLQWLRLTGKNPSLRAHENNPALPVEQVSWFDCEAQLRLQSLTLPTDSEWEAGCRAGTTTPWWTGVDRSAVGQMENTSSGQPHPVGANHPNPFGLHDMHGNLWEWCRVTLPSKNPHRGEDEGPEFSDWRTTGSRGGSCSLGPEFARASARYVDDPSARNSGLGVRPARALWP